MLHHHILFTIAFLAPVTIAIGQTIVERAASDEIAYMGREEKAMKEAFLKASATLGEFLSVAASPRPGTSGYALKVAISDGRNTEYFWVNGFSREGERFTGVLNNEPRLVKKHKLGERIEFTRAQVADWTYIDGANKRMVGNFTACALLTKEPPAQAEEFKRRYGLLCE
jgi:uncharacterized protein YegJ (DUF2314 family)